MRADELMDNFLSDMLTRAVGSDFFAGGLALGVFGAAIGVFRMVYRLARAQALGTRRIVPAALQGWLLDHAQDPAAAAAERLLRGPIPAVAAESRLAVNNCPKSKPWHGE